LLRGALNVGTFETLPEENTFENTIEYFFESALPVIDIGIRMFEISPQSLHNEYSQLRKVSV
jgi:hypothetical protein